MAELHAGGEAFAPALSRGGMKTLSTALGALTALAVGGAVAWWGWGLTTRSIDDIPVVRALDGPMKRRPVDPGGLTLDTTDLSINTMLTGREAQGTALAPAPERPMAEDLPAPRLTAPIADTSGAAPARVVAGLDRPLGPFETPLPGRGAASSPATPFTDRLEAQRKLARETAAADAAANAAKAEAADALAAAQAALAAPAPATLSAAPPVDPPDAGVAAPRVAPVSYPRPEKLAQLRAEETAASRAAAASAAAAAPRIIALGDAAVQFGAFESIEVAEAQWVRQMRRNPDLLDSYIHTVTTVRSGGRTLFRLRAGPMGSLDDAKNLCVAIEARGDACYALRVK
ncbi:MAG: hypothetical protein ACJA1L_001392 [Paracoccaceae bacterium]|jgi:hypothetical protein